MKQVFFRRASTATAGIPLYFKGAVRSYVGKDRFKPLWVRLSFGIPEILSRLRGAGLSLAVATSKPEEYAKRILEHFGLDKYFTVCAGADMEEKRSTKASVIERALSLTGVSPQKAVMIGDREHDIIGAKAFDMASIGVLYGFGSKEELTRAGADYIAASPQSLCEILL